MGEWRILKFKVLGIALGVVWIIFVISIPHIDGVFASEPIVPAGETTTATFKFTQKETNTFTPTPMRTDTPTPPSANTPIAIFTTKDIPASIETASPTVTSTPMDPTTNTPTVTALVSRSNP